MHYCLDLGELYETDRVVAVKGLVDLEEDLEKRLKYIDFIDIYADLDDNERAEYQRDYPNEAKTMSRFSECFIKQGRLEGQAMILLRQLQLKFGDVPEAVRRRIERADPQTLLAWSERY